MKDMAKNTEIMISLGLEEKFKNLNIKEKKPKEIHILNRKFMKIMKI